MERNHTVQVGDIFAERATDECGSSTSFYQVVRLRGKTLADVSLIGCDFYIDETCDSARSQCRAFPKKDHFYDESNITTTRVYYSETFKEYSLHTVETKENRHFRRYFYLYHPENIYCFSGYDGRFIIDKLGLKPKTEE